MLNNLPSFSLWCDFIERNFIEKDFVELISNGYINGATSNPAIFKSAFLNSSAYSDEKRELENKSPKEIYEALAIKDISLAANKLMTLYLNDNDGYISLEVDPFFDNNTQETINEGHRLYSQIGMPNVMIKIPATQNGYIAMTELMSQGININATLVFSPTQARKCIEAFREGKNKFLTKFPNADRAPAGVISVFVSRFDKKLDSKIQSLKLETSKVGIMNANLIYNIIEEEKLDDIRCLFASTGVKTQGLEKDYYIKELLFKNSINTAPIDALQTFVKNKELCFKNPLDNNELIKYFENLQKLGIDMEKTYQELMNEGLSAFHEAFTQIIESL